MKPPTEPLTLSSAQVKHLTALQTAVTLAQQQVNSFTRYLIAEHEGDQEGRYSFTNGQLVPVASGTLRIDPVKVSSPPSPSR